MLEERYNIIDSMMLLDDEEHIYKIFETHLKGFLILKDFTEKLVSKLYSLVIFHA